jgi:hypothetical protein
MVKLLAETVLEIVATFWLVAPAPDTTMLPE